MSSTVKSIAYVHTADIDPSVVKSGATWAGLGNIFVTAAEKALETPPTLGQGDHYRAVAAIQRRDLTHQSRRSETLEIPMSEVGFAVTVDHMTRVPAASNRRLGPLIRC
jgi:hypothetical protein